MRGLLKTLSLRKRVLLQPPPPVRGEVCCKPQPKEGFAATPQSSERCAVTLQSEERHALTPQLKRRYAVTFSLIRGVL